MIGQGPAALAEAAGAPGRAPAPRWLWAVAVGILVPVLVPLGALLTRVAGGGSVGAATLWSARTAQLLGNTIALVAAVTLSAAVIGVGAAWLTIRTDLPGRRVWVVLVALPLVVPSYVVALALRSALGGRGLLADLTGVGFPAVTGFPGAWLALTITTYPFVYLVASAALRKLGRAPEEAARGLGASPWRVFRTVVLPQLRPAAGAGALLAALYTLSDFGAVSLMRFDAFTRVVYAQYQGRLDRTPAAVLATVLIVLALFILAAETRTRGRGAYHIEPFNGLFKNIFGWQGQVPVKGLKRVQLIVLGAVLVYQLVILYQFQADLPLGKGVKALLSAA